LLLRFFPSVRLFFFSSPFSSLSVKHKLDMDISLRYSVNDDLNADEVGVTRLEI